MKYAFNAIQGSLDLVASTAADVGITFPLAATLGGTGVANLAASTLTLGAATSITGGGTVGLGGFTLTVPATGTAALLATANVFTADQKINVNSTTALLVEQDGVKDNVLVVDTTNGRVGINKAPTLGALDITGGVFSTSQNKIDGTSDQIQLIVQGHSTQTANLTEWQNSSGTVLGGFSGDGRMGVGLGPQTRIGLYAIYASSSTTGTPMGANIVYSYGYGSSSTMANTTYSLRIDGSTSASYSGSYTGVLEAIKGVLTHNGTATLSNAYGADFQINNVSTGTITNAYGFMIQPPLNGGGGTVVNTYGLYIQSHTVGSTLNYAIYTNAGDNRFGDDVILNGADSDKLWLGAGKDMSLYYDGTSGYVKTSDVAASDLHITTGAAKTLVLDTSVYDDLQFQISSAKVTPNNLLPSWEAFTATTSEYAFSVNEEVDTYANELPHWWKEGTTGHAHLHITTKAVPAQEEKARFTVTFAYADTNEVWVEAPFTAELTIPISTTALTNFYLDLGDLTLTNYLVGTQIRCRVKRVAKSAGGTEYTGDIFITQCGIHLEKTRMGSRAELTS